MLSETLTRRTITVRGTAVTIHHYELFIDLLKQWKASGMSQEDIEELLLS